jgi:hypothetical protein
MSDTAHARGRQWSPQPLAVLSHGRRRPLPAQSRICDPMACPVMAGIDHVLPNDVWPKPWPALPMLVPDPGQ